MQRPSPQGLAIAISLLAGTAVLWAIATPHVPPRVIEAGFWFDDVMPVAGLLTPPLTPPERERVERIARSELAHAFAGLRIRISDRRDARYRIRVVPQLRDLRFKRPVGIAGESRAVPGFGGSGAVSFWFLANGALAHAPPDAERGTILEAIGRGIGRTAVHELTHQLLPTAGIHEGATAASYEFRSAARREHYYGDIEWGLAWPLLANRLGRAEGPR